MKKIIPLLLAFFIFQSQAQTIKVNQLGYNVNQPKKAIVPSEGGSSFQIIKSYSGEVAFEGELQEARTWNLSEDEVRIADFSSFADTGMFFVRAGNATSYHFHIQSANSYSALTSALQKGFYLWRASTPIEVEFATIGGRDYSRAAGHPDTEVLVHESAATAARPAGTVISSPRGWYDAGDYGKYTSNAAAALYPMLHAYQMNENYFLGQIVNIPESGNSMADLLDEIKWELSWLLTMQDSNDGGVYHKLSCLNFTGVVMPESSVETRYVIGKSTGSALSFAAVMAKSSVVFKELQPSFADSCLHAAESAYNWALQNDNVIFSNPVDVSTGPYDDSEFNDNFLWAATELLLATNKSIYADAIEPLGNCPAPEWRNVGGFALMSAANAPDSITFSHNMRNVLADSLIALADRLVANTEACAYSVPIDEFFWGSNGYLANMGAVLACAYSYTNHEAYLSAAYDAFDYLLGRNPIDYCFVTGFGWNSTKYVHDRRSQADNNPYSIPGYLAGGANSGNVDEDCFDKHSIPPAKAYLDRTCSYTTNEIAINWNGGLVFLASYLDNLNFMPFNPVVKAETGEHANQIVIQLSKFISGNLLAENCIVSANGEQIAIQALEKIADFKYSIALSSDISNQNDSIVFSYSGGNINLNNKPVEDFSAMVKNTMQPALPEIIEAYTNVAGDTVIVVFSEKVEVVNEAGLAILRYGENLISGLTYREDSLALMAAIGSIGYSDVLLLSAEQGSIQSVATERYSTHHLVTVKNNKKPPVVAITPYIALLLDGHSVEIYFEIPVQVGGEVDLKLHFNNAEVLDMIPNGEYENMLFYFATNRKIVPDDVLYLEYNGGFFTQDGAEIEFADVEVQNKFNGYVPLRFTSGMMEVLDDKSDILYYVGYIQNAQLYEVAIEVEDEGDYTFDIVWYGSELGAIGLYKSQHEQLGAVELTGSLEEGATGSVTIHIDETMEKLYMVTPQGGYATVTISSANESGVKTDERILAVYPTVQKSGGVLYFDQFIQETSTYSIYSASGAVIVQSRLQGNQIQLPQLSAGIYTVVMCNGEQSMTQKILVSK